MIIKKFRTLALNFPEAVEAPHFEATSFRVKKKIFATYDAKKDRACLKLSGVDQSVYSDLSKGSIHTVPNAWGKQGWTFVELATVSEELLKDALTSAFCEVAPKKLAELLRKEM